MTDNFLWSIESPEGDLLAYQEKPTKDQPDPKVEIIDEARARQQCLDKVIASMNNVTLNYQVQLQEIGYVLFSWRRLIGLDTEVKKKSSLVLPDGQGGFK